MTPISDDDYEKLKARVAELLGYRKMRRVETVDLLGAIKCPQCGKDMKDCECYEA